MAQDIKKIPSSELVQDYFDSKTDIGNCNIALSQGHTQYSGGSIEGRKRKNEQFMQLIAAELDRRGELYRIVT